VLIIFELTGDYAIVLPLMVTCALATTVSRQLQPHSLYTAGLRRRNLPVPEMPRPEWLRATQVEALMQMAVDTVAPMTPFPDVVVKLLTMRGGDLYVAGPQGEFLGILALDAIKGHIPEQANLSMVVAADVMDTSTQGLEPAMTLTQAARRFASTDLGRLPVVEPGTGRLMGSVAKTDLLRRGRF
jgi:CIC family chloride channel protein